MRFKASEQPDCWGVIRTDWEVQQLLCVCATEEDAQAIADKMRADVIAEARTKARVKYSLDTAMPDDEVFVETVGFGVEEVPFLLAPADEYEIDIDYR